MMRIVALLAGLLALCLCAGGARADTAPVSPPSSSPGGVPALTSQALPSDDILLSLGASGWSGRFGAPTTTQIDAVLIGARYKIGDLRLAADLPWMRIDTAGAVFTGVDGTPLVVSPTAGTQKKLHEGLGDLTLTASYLVSTPQSLGLDLDLTAKVKLPTGSVANQISTGRADSAFGAELSRPIGRFAPFVSLTWREFGSTSQWRLKDGAAVSAGTNFYISPTLVGGLSYDYAQRATSYVADAREVVGSLSWRIANSGARITGFAAAGLSRGAAAASGGVSIAFGF